MSEHPTHPSSPAASPRRDDPRPHETEAPDWQWRGEFLHQDYLDTVLDETVRGDDHLSKVVREVGLASPEVLASKDARQDLLKRAASIWDHCRAQEERCQALEEAYGQEKVASGLHEEGAAFRMGPARRKLVLRAVITVALLAVLGVSWRVGAASLAPVIVVLTLVAGWFLLDQVDRVQRAQNLLAASRDRHDNASKDLKEALKHGVVLEFRRLVNERLGAERGASMTVRPGHDLSAEPCLPDLQIMGRAHARLQERIDTSDRGGFAVASRDGGGATTLLKWILWDRKRPARQITVHLEAAPGEATKDFLIRLGLAIIDEVLGRKDKTKSIEWYLRRLRMRRLLHRSGWFLCLAGAAVLAYRLSPLSASTGTAAQDRIASAMAWASAAATQVETWAFVVVAIGVGLILANVMLAVRPPARRNSHQLTKPLVEAFRSPPDRSDRPEVEVYGPGFELDRVDFFKVRFPFWKPSQQRAASLSDVRERLREYLTSDDIQKRGILVGIDDIAKLEDPARFLDGVIGVFDGVKRCRYVVTCRSGLLEHPGHNRWFTASVELEPNDFEHSMRVLRRRVIGLGPPYGALCHVLAGGHPRALLNVAQEVVRQPRGSNLVDVCSDLITRHVKAKRDELSGELSERHDAERLRRWLLRNCARVLEAGPIRVQAFRDACIAYARVDADAERLADPAVATRVQSFVSFMYVCATLMEVLGRFPAETPEAEEDGEDAWRRFTGEKVGTGEGTTAAVERLARACHKASEDPVSAWRMTSEFRAAWRLELFRCPFVVV